jgi:hypothetical protein
MVVENNGEVGAGVAVAVDVGPIDDGGGLVRAFMADTEVNTAPETVTDPARDRSFSAAVATTPVVVIIPVRSSFRGSVGGGEPDRAAAVGAQHQETPRPRRSR